MAVKRIPALVVAGVAMVGLSGCAGGGEPGVAAKVGDVSVSQDAVNALVNAECQTAGVITQQVPRSAVVNQVVNVLVRHAAADAYFKANPVTYDQQQLTANLATFTEQLNQQTDATEENARVLTDFIRADIRTGLQKAALGQRLLREQGTANPNADQASAAGEQAVGRWSQQQGITLNPRYNPGPNGQAGGGSSSISRATSELSKKLAEGDPTVISELPAKQVCGNPGGKVNPQ